MLSYFLRLHQYCSQFDSITLHASVLCWLAAAVPGEHHRDLSWQSNSAQEDNARNEMNETKE